MSAAYVKKGCLMTAGTLYLWAVSPPFRLSISISNSSNKLVAPLGWSFGEGVGWVGAAAVGRGPPLSIRGTQLGRLCAAGARWR